MPNPSSFIFCALVVLQHVGVADAGQRKINTQLQSRQQVQPAGGTVRYRRQSMTPLTQGLVYANVGAFILLARSPKMFASLAKNDAAIARHGQYHRMLTSTFLHSGVAHLGINMISLNRLGTTTEPWFGSQRLAATYMLSGLAGNALSLKLGTAPLSVGASGAIFGLLGAWGVFLQRNEKFFASSGVSVSSSLRSLLESCALTAAIGFSPGSRIDNMGHFGGLCGGAVCSYLFGPRLSRRRVVGPAGSAMIVIDRPIVPLFPPARETPVRRKLLPPRTRMPPDRRVAVRNAFL